MIIHIQLRETFEKALNIVFASYKSSLKRYNVYCIKLNTRINIQVLHFWLIKHTFCKINNFFLY